MSQISFINFALIFAIASLQSCTCAKIEDSVKIDGSSTVYVISEAIAEEFIKTEKGRVSIGVSGTGGGFKKFCSHRVDIIGASREITESEKLACRRSGVDYLELPVAYDGIVVAVNKANTWLTEISVSNLKKIFEPEAEGKIVMWSHIDASFPPYQFELFTPGISSGTYDYFTKAIMGIAHNSRGDMTTSEDDNVLVHGIRSTKDALGFFSFAYFLENQQDLKALAIIDNKKAKGVLPSFLSIREKEYTPLSRTVFIYANKNVNAASKNFIKFYIHHSASIAKDVGFIPLNDEDQKKALATARVLDDV